MKNHRHSRRSLRLYTGCLVVALIAIGCTKKVTDPEIEVKTLIETVERHVESRDLKSIKELIAQDYRDTKGFNRQKVIAALQLQFLKKSSIHLLTRITRLTMSDDGREAEVKVLVAMAGQAVESINRLKGLRANLMKFTFRLRKEGDDWRVESSQWNRAKISDFLAAAIHEDDEQDSP